MILTTLLNIAVFQGIVLGIIILKSPLFKSRANNYLAFAIFSLSNSLLSLVLEITELTNKIPLLRIFDIIDSGVIFPIFIFLFVVHQVHHPIRHSKKLWWLLLPYLCEVVSSVINEFIDLYPSAGMLQWWGVVFDLIQLFISLCFIPTILVCTYLFITYSKNKQEKKWLTHLWLLTFILFVSWVVIILFSLVFSYDVTPVMRMLSLFGTFLIHWIAYSGIFKFRLAKDQEEINALINKRKPAHTEHTDSIIAAVHSPKDTIEKKNTSLTKENPYFQKLEILCIQQQLYRDPTLDRDKVAEKLGISSGYVSQLVNTVTGKNFTSYINHYRVEAVKEIMLDPQFDHYSLLAIGLECGFSSKTTFHSAFKKITGLTPNAYRKKHR